MPTDFVERALNIIAQVPHLTLATTSAQGQPWNTPLGFAYDEQLNFFWTSAKETQHSHNIQHNEKVFLVIYNSTMPSHVGEGVFIEAVAHELSKTEDILYARKLMKGTDEDALEKFSGNSKRRAYRAQLLTTVDLSKPTNKPWSTYRPRSCLP